MSGRRKPAKAKRLAKNSRTLTRPTTVRGQRLLSLGEAARLLGWNKKADPQRLRRLLYAVETKRAREGMVAPSHEVMIRGMGGTAPKLRITLALLRQHCPGLFGHRDEVAEKIAQQVDLLREEFDGEFTELFQRQDLLAEKLTKMEQRQNASACVTRAPKG